MKKSDKKIDNTLRLALTEVCEMALEEVSGFQWLTHIVHFPAFPSSLSIICVFETNKALEEANCSGQLSIFERLTQDAFQRHGIAIKHIKQHIYFDTEENCEQQHAGKWKDRFQSPRL